MASKKYQTTNMPCLNKKKSKTPDITKRFI